MFVKTNTALADTTSIGSHAAGTTFTPISSGALLSSDGGWHYATVDVATPTSPSVFNHGNINSLDAYNIAACSYFNPDQGSGDGSGFNIATSSDGNNWTNCSTLPPWGSSIYSVVNVSNTGRIFAGMDGPEGSPTYWDSTLAYTDDLGVTWNSWTTGPGGNQPFGRGQVFALDIIEDGTMLAGGQPATGAFIPWSTLENSLAVLVSGTWEAANDGSGHVIFDGNPVFGSGWVPQICTHIVHDKNDQTGLVVASGSYNGGFGEVGLRNIAYSRDFGHQGTWQYCASLPPGFSTGNGHVAVKGQRIIADVGLIDGATSVLYFSDDYGTTWNPCTMPSSLPHPYGNGVFGLKQIGLDIWTITGGDPGQILISSGGSWFGTTSGQPMGSATFPSGTNFNQLAFIKQYNGFTAWGRPLAGGINNDYHHNLAYFDLGPGPAGFAVISVFEGYPDNWIFNGALDAINKAGFPVCVTSGPPSTYALEPTIATLNLSGPTNSDILIGDVLVITDGFNDAICMSQQVLLKQSGSGPFTLQVEFTSVGFAFGSGVQVVNTSERFGPRFGVKILDADSAEFIATIGTDFTGSNLAKRSLVAHAGPVVYDSSLGCFLSAEETSVPFAGTLFWNVYDANMNQAAISPNINADAGAFPVAGFTDGEWDWTKEGFPGSIEQIPYRVSGFVGPISVGFSKELKSTFIAHNTGRVHASDNTGLITAGQCRYDPSPHFSGPVSMAFSRVTGKTYAFWSSASPPGGGDFVVFDCSIPDTTTAGVTASYSYSSFTIPVSLIRSWFTGISVGISNLTVGITTAYCHSDGIFWISGYAYDPTNTQLFSWVAKFDETLNTSSVPTKIWWYNSFIGSDTNFNLDLPVPTQISISNSGNTVWVVNNFQSPSAFEGEIGRPSLYIFSTLSPNGLISSFTTPGGFVNTSMGVKGDNLQQFQGIFDDLGVGLFGGGINNVAPSDYLPVFSGVACGTGITVIPRGTANPSTIIQNNRQPNQKINSAQGTITTSARSI